MAAVFMVGTSAFRAFRDDLESGERLARPSKHKRAVPKPVSDEVEIALKQTGSMAVRV